MEDPRWLPAAVLKKKQWTFFFTDLGPLEQNKFG
jgi:hypothetical protein